jgi:hypothetical protein
MYHYESYVKIQVIDQKDASNTLTMFSFLLFRKTYCQFFISFVDIISKVNCFIILLK